MFISRWLWREGCSALNQQFTSHYRTSHLHFLCIDWEATSIWGLYIVCTHQQSSCRWIICKRVAKITLSTYTLMIFCAPLETTSKSPSVTPLDHMPEKYYNILVLFEGQVASTNTKKPCTGRIVILQLKPNLPSLKFFVALLYWPAMGQVYRCVSIYAEDWTKKENMLVAATDHIKHGELVSPNIHWVTWFFMADVLVPSFTRRHAWPTCLSRTLQIYLNCKSSWILAKI